VSGILPQAALIATNINDESGRAIIADFREGLTCLIDTQFFTSYCRS
jgi:hypothetical protein